MTPPILQGGDQVFTNEITKFLLKKDLLLSRLSSFNDRPESYAIWKTSFKSIMIELSVSPFEELDLLVKWLGPESKKFAMSIRASNPTQPKRGLECIWERLNERFGSPELVEAALKKKLESFPKLSNKDSQRLYDLLDIVTEIESAKESDPYQALLAYFDTSSGIKPIVCKLPPQLQEKWTTRASNYKVKNGVTFPPFSFFCAFIREMSRVRNDPAFDYEAAFSNAQGSKGKASSISAQRSVPVGTLVAARKTEIAHSPDEPDTGSNKFCPIHNTKHPLNQCRAFKAKSLEDRKKVLKEHKICFRCCNSNKHLKRACIEEVKCADCGSGRHPTALHVTESAKRIPASSATNHGGEETQHKDVISIESVTSRCTQICGNDFGGKSCAKNILVKVYPQGHPERSQSMYAIIDDQSNRSLASTGFFTIFGINGMSSEYKLSSCAGLFRAAGRRATGYVIESFDGNTQFDLPSLVECNEIPSIRDEIPTPEVASHYSHLQDIAGFIPPLDNQSEILLLIGRDLLEAHHVLDQRIGPRNTPYGQRLPLGWVVIGESCLGKRHKPDFINVSKTHLLANGRPSRFQPCENEFTLKEIPFQREDGLGYSSFERTPDDDKPGLSFEDRQFLRIMDKNFKKSAEGNWVAPLPFRRERPRLPNNRSQAERRARNLDHSLKKNPVKKEHFVEFMKKVLDSGSAEVAPPLAKGEEFWYLPVFGVYHPKKPEQIRGVFDSSATCDGISLNSVLFSGPDLINSLLGVLLRFRKEPVAITADIEQMFYSFLVQEDHRNFL